MIWFKYIFPENNSYLTAAKEYNNNLNNKYWLAFKAVYKILAQYPNCIKNIISGKKIPLFFLLKYSSQLGFVLTI